MEIEVRGGAWMKKERVQNITMDKTEYSLIRLDSVYPEPLVVIPHIRPAKN
jgi:hypothetical protein